VHGLFEYHPLAGRGSARRWCGSGGEMITRRRLHVSAREAPPAPTTTLATGLLLVPRRESSPFSSRQPRIPLQSLLVPTRMRGSPSL
jgi:hypothetical protein